MPAIGSLALTLLVAFSAIVAVQSQYFDYNNDYNSSPNGWNSNSNRFGDFGLRSGDIEDSGDDYGADSNDDSGSSSHTTDDSITDDGDDDSKGNNDDSGNSKTDLKFAGGTQTQSLSGAVSLWHPQLRLSGQSSSKDVIIFLY